MLVSVEIRRGLLVPWFMNGYEPRCGFRELNLGPRLEQQGILSTELSI